MSVRSTVMAPQRQVMVGGGLPWNRQRSVALPPSLARTSGSVSAATALGACGSSAGQTGIVANISDNTTTDLFTAQIDKF